MLNWLRTMLPLLRVLILIYVPISCSIFQQNSPFQPQPGYGYVGPSCAVVNGFLYIHGVSQRKLNDQELRVFDTYQHDLSYFKDASPYFDSFESSPPIMPKFCGGYDDTIEIVLDSCIVRSNHVYIGDQLIRALNNFEKQKIQMLKMQKMYGESRRRRLRRDDEPGMRPQHDFTEMLHRLLKVNSTVTQRFLPVVSQSPLFAMEAPWRSIVDSSARDSNFANSIDITKIDNPYHRARYMTKAVDVIATPASTTTAKTTTTTTTTTTTSATTTLKPKTSAKVRQISIPTAAPPKRTKTEVRADESVVVDPLLLRLIAKALENNEMIDETKLSQQFETTPIPLRFVAPSNRPSPPAHNHLHFSHFEPEPEPLINRPPISLSHRLPNEICRAHLIQIPY